MSATAVATEREPGRVAALVRKVLSACSADSWYGERPSRTAWATSRLVVCQSEAYMPGSRMVTSTFQRETS